MNTPNILRDAIPRPRPDFQQLLRVLRRQGGTPAHVPLYELFVNREVQEALLGKRVPDQLSTIAFYYQAGYDYVPVWPVLAMPIGSLIDTTSDYPIKDWSSLAAYPWPSPSDIDFRWFDIVAERLPQGMQIIGQTSGIIERAQELCGYVGLCTFLAMDRDLVRELFEKVGKLYVAMYEGMASREAVGAVVISDDLGYKSQTLVAPDDIREFVLPWHERLAQAIHRHGKPCIMHSCGQVGAVMEDLIDYVGIDAKHSFEDQILPVTEAKALYGDRIAILGGFDVDRLCRSTPEEIRDYTRMLIECCGEGGGYAFGSGNSIADFVPIPNYLTMLHEAWRSRE